MTKHYRRLPSLIISKMCQIFFHLNWGYTSTIIHFNKNTLTRYNFKKYNLRKFTLLVYIYEYIKNLIKEVPFIQSKSSENSKSAPNILKFLYYGSLYSLTIIYCLMQN